jgi:hypothetical protein
MFDQTPPPNNLPIEPEVKTPPSQPSSLRGGIIPSAQHEPEDILAGATAESDESSQQEDASLYEERSSAGGNNRMRLIMIILASVAGLFILVVGGLFAYQKFFVTSQPIEDQTIVPIVQPSGTEDELPLPGYADLDGNEQAEMQDDFVSEEEPVVEPTPIPDIPKPKAVGEDEEIDTDGDGLTDAIESRIKTDPNNADTDGDGLPDGEEDSLQTDPLVADMDGDDLSDGDEVRVWKTDPKTADTDGDSFSDGSEVKNGYNPLGSGKLPTME